MFLTNSCPKPESTSYENFSHQKTSSPVGYPADNPVKSGHTMWDIQARPADCCKHQTAFTMPLTFARGVSIEDRVEDEGGLRVCRLTWKPHIPSKGA